MLWVHVLIKDSLKLKTWRPKIDQQTIREAVSNRIVLCLRKMHFFQ